MDSEFMELSRCRDAESVNETTDLLKSAGIPYRVGTTAEVFDISAIGSGRTPEVIVSVRTADYASARAAMEEEFLKHDLPDDHYLLTASDSEIAEILGNPSEWSPFDVAHARVIAGNRGIELAMIERQNAGRIRQLERGKSAPQVLLIVGWVFSILGGVIGLVIAWSLCTMKETTPEGEFFTYDERSRKAGRSMLILASVMTGVTITLRLSGILPD